MKRGLATVAIILIGVLANLGFLMRVIDRTGDTAYSLGRVVGGSIAPFLFGMIIPLLWGMWRKSEAGAFHRRTNWFAFIIVVGAWLGNSFGQH